jgi:tetratricopeptide (TPR) repeat protein
MVGEDTDTQELTMVCMRNNIPLRVARMHPSPEALSTKNELRLSVMREGSRFTFQVNDLPAVAMQDMFPEQSHKEQFFSLYAQPQTAIRQIRILRQRSPITPSSLEKGDELFNAGKFSEAMTFYQQQAIESVGRAGQEARLKVGMCLFLLKRQEEAAQQFEQVLNEEGERWPALAGCHLLVIRSIQRRATDVDSVYRTLRGRFPQSLISEILPEYSRAQLLQDSNAQSFLGLSLFGRLTPQQVEDARQQREFARLFTGEPTYADLMLVRAYSLSNQPAKATEAAEDALDRPYILPFSRMLFEDYGALMCQQEKANEGLLRVNDALLDGEGRIKADRLSLLVVRARLHIATKELAEAEKDIEEFIKLSANGHERYETEALAGLIRGFLRQDRGDTAGAAADFRYASAPQYLVRHRLPANTDISTLIGGMNPTTALLIAGSMADDITDAELQSIINFTLERVGGSDDASQNRAAAGVLLFRSGVVKLPPSTLRDIWRTPRGKQTAREIVFRSLPLPELGRKTFVLGMYQYFLQGCTRTALATEEDNFLWEHSTVCCEVLRDHKLGKSQLLKITLAWNGTTNFLGWGGVEQSLEKPFRASMAYWLGKHYLFTGQKEAGQMFRTAADNSEADSTVHKLADVELQKLGNN